jgi:chromosomal replication initiator protein
VPIEVLEHIASLVSDNIRELEGALTRVTAWSALNRRDIDFETAERVLRDIVTTDEPVPLSPEIIMRTTASAYGFSVEDVLSPSRRQPLVLCRQISMYLCRELTDLSLPKIGQAFQRDHTTVLHSVDKVKRILRSDRAVFDRVTQLTQDLRKGMGISPGT